MLVEFYPNGEIRATIPPLTSGARPSSCLSFKTCDLKVPASEYPDACRYPQCDWPRVGYGGLPKRRPFSIRGRRLISRCGGCYAPSEDGLCVFVTGTLPGSTEESLEGVARESSWMVHELLTRVPRLFGIQSRDLLVTWVWEHQKRGALHWHAAIEFPERLQAEEFCRLWHGLWCSVLEGAAVRRGVDLFARVEGGTWAGQREVWRTDAQIAWSTPSQYLSKYLTKGSAGGHQFYPTRWYGVSRRLLSLLRERKKVFFLPMCDRVDFLSTAGAAFLAGLGAVSSFVVAFSNPVTSAFTQVAYCQEAAVVDSLIKEYGLMEMSCELLFSNVFRRWRSPLYSTTAARWEYVDRLERHPDLAEELWNWLDPLGRVSLNAYLSGQPYVTEEMAWADRAANRILYLRGFFVPSPFPPPPPSICNRLTEKRPSDIIAISRPEQQEIFL